MVGSVLVVVRHATFQWVADPTMEQARALARHEGAARFAFNQGLRLPGHQCPPTGRLWPALTRE
jgi:hypothetical protein